MGHPLITGNGQQATNHYYFPLLLKQLTGHCQIPREIDVRAAIAAFEMEGDVLLAMIRFDHIRQDEWLAVEMKLGELVAVEYAMGLQPAAESGRRDQSLHPRLFSKGLP